jgi:hypothetical protein
VSGRTPAEAVSAYRLPIQNVLSCFATGRLSVSNYNPAKPGVLTFNSGNPTRLKGAAGLSFVCSQNYVIVPTNDAVRKWKVHTTKYIYRLIGRDNAGIVDYHWHPDNTSDKAFPHLHAVQYSCKLHHPTGRVLIEDLLVLAVECGAVPSDDAKWQRILKRNLTNFAKGATWGIPKL